MTYVDFITWILENNEANNNDIINSRTTIQCKLNQK